MSCPKGIKRSEDYKRRWSEERKKSWDARYPINYSFFSCMSHDLAYFLGYLAGDGGAWSDERTVAIESIEDPYIIYKFRDLIAPNHKVILKKPGKGSYGIRSCYMLQIARESFWSLISFYDVKAPSVWTSDRISSEYKESFIRGFMDSDGKVVLLTRKTCYGLEVSFTQKDGLYLEALDIVLRLWGLIPAPIDVNEKGVHILRLRLDDSLSLLKRLYCHKGDLYLRRKYDIYLKVVESRGDRSSSEIHNFASSLYKEGSVYNLSRSNAVKRAWVSRRANIVLV